MTTNNERQNGACYLCLLVLVLIQTCDCSQIHENHRRQCHSAEGHYQHGEVFSRDRSAVCLRYKCEHGQEILIETKCRDENGLCYQMGQTAQRGQCVQQTCTMSGGYVSMKTTTRECAFKGQCVKVGQVVTEGCLSYRCTQVILGEDKFRLGMEQETAGCPHLDNSGCLSLGQTIKCGSLICELRDNLIGFYPVKSVCEERDTRHCYDIGATWQNKDCVTLRCEADLFGSNKYATRAVPVSRGCSDNDGKCHEPDGVSLFPVIVQGQLRQCVCQQEQTTVQYSCMASHSVT